MNRNLPVGGVVFTLVLSFLTLVGIDQSTREISIATKLRRLDLPGVVLLISSVSCLFLALQEGSTKVSWSSSKPIGLFIGFGLLFVTFGVWQWKAGESATVPLRYLKDRTVIWGSIYLFWDNMASYIVRFLGHCAQQTTDSAVDDLLHAVLLPSGPGQYCPSQRYQLHVSCSTTDDRSLCRWGYHHCHWPLCMLYPDAEGDTYQRLMFQMPVILFAQILCGVGAGLLTTLRTSTSTATWATFMALTGLGIGLGVNVPHIAIQAVMKT